MTIAILFCALPAWSGTDNEPSAPHQIKAHSGVGEERAISEASDAYLPGNRLVRGRVKDLRGDQMEIDIGNLQPLFVPLRPAQDKGQQFKSGDAIMVTMNDHNMVVDYHHPGERAHHEVFKGRLETPLTVGLDKAVIDTGRGTKTYMIAERAKGKLTAMPVGPDIWFMADETGALVDAQLASAEAVHESGENNKARIKGAHRQLRAVFQGSAGDGQLKISEDGKERQLPYRSPLAKLDQVKKGQQIVLLLDDQGYVLEIASPEIPPSR
jgi:hypothetical protein